MPRPIIFIGVGSSGFHVLEECEQYFNSYATDGRIGPRLQNTVQYIFLETDMHVEAAAGSRMRGVKLRIDNMISARERLDRTTAKEWAPSINILSTHDSGAGGHPVCGRLALWGSLPTEQSNFLKVKAQIEQAHREATSGASDTPLVIITGSLGGGTGSGVFIDLAYMAREFIPHVEPLGLFLLPSDSETPADNGKMLANAYVSLDTLAYFDSEAAAAHGARYQETWPTLNSEKFVSRPYKRSFLISKDYGTGAQSMHELKGLCKMAGYFLFLNTVGLDEVRERIVTDQGDVKYSTFGLSVMQFPHGMIEEYLAAKEGKKLFESCVDTNQIWINGVPQKNRNVGVLSGKRDARRRWDDILAGALALMEPPSFAEKIDADLQRLLRENGPDIQKTFRALFNSESRNEYYTQLLPTKRPARDHLISGIHGYVDELLDASDNLEYAIAGLVELRGAIDETLKYWAGLKVHTSNWDDGFRSLQTAALHRLGTAYLEKPAILRERLLDVITLLKTHHLRPDVEEVYRQIDNAGSIQPLRTTGLAKPVALPRLPDLRTMRDRFRILATRVDERGNVPTFTRKMDDIEITLRDQTIPVFYVYPSGSFQKHVQEAEEAYRQAAEQVPGSRFEAVFDKKASVLFDELFSQEQAHGAAHTDPQARLYHNVMRFMLASVRQRAAVRRVPVSGQVDVMRLRDAARRATANFLHLRNPNSGGPNCPRVVVADSTATAVEAVRRLRTDLNYHDFVVNPAQGNTSRDCLEVPALVDSILLYDERPVNNPLGNIAAIDDWRNYYEHPNEDAEHLETVVFQKLRHAYPRPKTEAANTDAVPANGASSA